MSIMTDREELKVIAAYIVVCIVWGSTYLGIRIGVSGFPPGLFTGIRNLIAGAIVLIYARLKGLEFPRGREEIRRLATVGGFLLCGCQGLVSWAEQWVHSGIASLIMASAPLLVALIEILVLRESTLDIKGCIGLLIGFGGVATLVVSASGIGSVDLVGSLLLLIAATSWAVGSVYSKSFTASGSMITHIGIQMLAGGVGITVIGLLLGEAARVSFTLRSMLALGYLILFGSILGYSSYIYVLSKWPPTRAATYSYINPLVAVSLGYLILREPITVHTIISTLIILGGVIMVQVSQASRAKIKQEISSQR